MKKTRYIPYGYTIRNGRTVVDRGEAEIIQYIFQTYIKGASLKELADDLTRKGIPYTEKSAVWDKARIARIIGNAKYLGVGDYDPIVDEDTYEKAISVKEARMHGQIEKSCAGIRQIRNRVRCAECGAVMIHRAGNASGQRESWICQNEACGVRVFIRDGELLQKIAILMNRIIENPLLLIPKKPARRETPAVMRLQREIDAELERDVPSQQVILDRIMEMANRMYSAPENANRLSAYALKRHALRLQLQEDFNGSYFADLIDNVILDRSGRVTLITKSQTEITKGDDEDGCSEDSEEDGF